jgi:hypothetical protein
MYQIAQAVLYVCVLYFMAGFDRTAGKWLLHTCCEAVKMYYVLLKRQLGFCSDSAKCRGSFYNVL